MCGIAGHVRFTEQPNPAHISNLVNRIRHRGPNDSGLWVSPGKECVLGHARLSIIDLSPLGHQPMVDAKTGNALVFNGEIYNFQLLRKECEAAGDTFRSQSDTEVILALYRRHGVTCLDKLRGMFAFALWDEQKKRLFLARDRVGKKPLNYALTKSGIVFCSEIAPLSRHPAISRKMDIEGLDLYLQLQYIPAPWTIYQGIRKLPPAHYAMFDLNRFQVDKYWDVDYTKKIAISEQDALDGLEEKLSEAVRLRMIADVPLGALLSGGVDSSLVVALMAKLSDNRIKTYSIGFREEAFNELPFAQQAADICGTAHHPEIVEGDVAHLLPTLVHHYGEPYADSSAIPAFHVCHTAQKHVTVVLNGDGGDELLGGYGRYCLPPLSVIAGSRLGHYHTAERLAKFVVGLEKARSFSARLRRKWLLRFTHPELQSIMYNGFWNDDERATLLGEGKTLLASWRTSWLGDARNAAANPIDRMLWIDNRTYLPGDLLVKMDIASMHCGLEARSPLLDHQVIEFCASLPTHLKVRNGIGKYLLKKLAERYFSQEFVYRKKMGFGIPLAEWLRGKLRPLTEQILLDRGLMEPLRESVIRGTLKEFYTGQGDHSSRVWALLMYGLWRRTLA